MLWTFARTLTSLRLGMLRTSTGTLGTFLITNLSLWVRDVRPWQMELTYLIRDVSVLEKTKDLMLITSLNPTDLWCFSPVPNILALGSIPNSLYMYFDVIIIFSSMLRPGLKAQFPRPSKR